MEKQPFRGLVVVLSRLPAGHVRELLAKVEAGGGIAMTELHPAGELQVSHLVLGRQQGSKWEWAQGLSEVSGTKRAIDDVDSLGSLDTVQRARAQGRVWVVKPQWVVACSRSGRCEPETGFPLLPDSMMHLSPVKQQRDDAAAVASAPKRAKLKRSPRHPLAGWNVVVIAATGTKSSERDDWMCRALQDAGACLCLPADADGSSATCKSTRLISALKRTDPAGWRQVQLDPIVLADHVDRVDCAVVADGRSLGILRDRTSHATQSQEAEAFLADMLSQTERAKLDLLLDVEVRWCASWITHHCQDPRALLDRFGTFPLVFQLFRGVAPSQPIDLTRLSNSPLAGLRVAVLAWPAEDDASALVRACTLEEAALSWGAKAWNCQVSSSSSSATASEYSSLCVGGVDAVVVVSALSGRCDHPEGVVMGGKRHWSIPESLLKLAEERHSLCVRQRGASASLPLSESCPLVSAGWMLACVEQQAQKQGAIRLSRVEMRAMASESCLAMVTGGGTMELTPLGMAWLHSDEDESAMLMPRDIRVHVPHRMKHPHTVVTERLREIGATVLARSSGAEPSASSDSLGEAGTHLLSDRPVRTLNVLQAIASGMWVVTSAWCVEKAPPPRCVPWEGFFSMGGADLPTPVTCDPDELRVARAAATDLAKRIWFHQLHPVPPLWMDHSQVQADLEGFLLLEPSAAPYLADVVSPPPDPPAELRQHMHSGAVLAWNVAVRPYPSASTSKREMLEDVVESLPTHAGAGWIQQHLQLVQAVISQWKKKQPHCTGAFDGIILLNLSETSSRSTIADQIAASGGAKVLSLGPFPPTDWLPPVGLADYVERSASRGCAPVIVVSVPAADDPSFLEEQARFDSPALWNARIANVERLVRVAASQGLKRALGMDGASVPTCCVRCEWVLDRLSRFPPPPLSDPRYRIVPAKA
jgi:hypothetical protein